MLLRGTSDQYSGVPHDVIDNIFVSFGGALFQQVVGIPMGMNFAPLLADLFLVSSKYRYIDDVLSINNPRFAEFLPLIYPPKL
jgi:UDP-N-acetylglucosamine pyrophosphorylase